MTTKTFFLFLKIAFTVLMVLGGIWAGIELVNAGAEPLELRVTIGVFVAIVLGVIVSMLWVRPRK